MQKDRPVVLSIAGFDPSAGAGVLADIKTFEAHHVYGIAVLTCNTLQTENRFISAQWLPLEEVCLSVTTILQNYRVNAIKIGVVKDFQYLKHIIQTIRKQSDTVFILWDPVWKSSTGFEFFKKIEDADFEFIATQIDLITPNAEEFQIINPPKHLLSASGKRLHWLIKGGHRTDKLGTDMLICDDKILEFAPLHTQPFAKHGSGCVFSAAVISEIAMGKTLDQVIKDAKSYTFQFLNSTSHLLGYHDFT